MNTLPKDVWQSFFLDKTAYVNFRQLWASQRDHNPVEHLLYMVLRGRDFTTAFTPVSNATKLDNGRRRYDTLVTGMQVLRYRLKMSKLDYASGFLKQSLEYLKPDAFENLLEHLPNHNQGADRGYVSKELVDVAA